MFLQGAADSDLLGGLNTCIICFSEEGLENTL